MRNAFCLLVGAALLPVACTQDSLFPGVSRWERQHTERTFTPPKDTTAGHTGPVLYLSAVRFIKGYDWQIDTAADRRHAEIVLLRDGKEIVHVNAGEDLSPDRILIREGHLYTERADGNCTVISRDGTEVLRFSGRESLRGFLIREGHLHTLSQRAGTGFSYRVDGKEVFRDDAGTILGGPDDGVWEGGALSADDDGIWYSYSVPVRKPDGTTLPEYRVMREGETAVIIPAGSFQQIFDIRRIGGTLYRTELRSTDNSSLCLVEGSVYHSLGLNSAQTPHLCRIIPSEGQVCVFGYHTEKSSGKSRYWLRTPEKTTFLAEWDKRVDGLRLQGKDQAWTVGENNRITRILKNGTALPLEPGQFHLMAESCIRLQNGTFYAAVTDMEDGNHRIYVDDKYTEISFNGYFTGLRVE